MAVYMKMPHRADIYTKTTTTSPAGQKKASWIKTQSSVQCFFVYKTPVAALNRTEPTFEQWMTVDIFFPANVNISASSRICNIRDRAGNIVNNNSFEITQITEQPGFSGKVHHYLVMAHKVIED